MLRRVFGTQTLTAPRLRLRTWYSSLSLNSLQEGAICSYVSMWFSVHANKLYANGGDLACLFVCYKLLRIP